MQALHIKTPLLESLKLNAFLKMDALQPSGSFKIRGLGHLCMHEALVNKARRFVACSGGNAGISVAYAGRKLGIPVQVVLPTTSSQLMIDHIRAEGAEVIINGEDLSTADILARSMVEQDPSSAYIPPFDHPMIWAGHATLIEELVLDGFKPDAVIVAVGGGGLMCGVIEGLHEAGWGDVPVLTAETKGAASFDASIKAGHLVTLDAIKTIATSLGAKRVAQKAFDWTKEHEIIPHVVSDEQATRACVQFAKDTRVMVEPACGAALALVYEPSYRKRFKNPLVVVCGGNGVSLELLEAWGRSASTHQTASGFYPALG